MSVFRFIGLLICCAAPVTSAVFVECQPSLGGEITVWAGDLEQYRPAVAYDSKRDRYLIAWHETDVALGRLIKGCFFSSEGVGISCHLLADATSGDVAQPALAYDPDYDQYLLAYIHLPSGGSGGWDVYGRLIPWDGPDSLQLPFPICTFGTDQQNPKVAYGPDMFMVTWWNDEPTTSTISAKAVPPDGVLSEPHLALSVASGPDERSAPDIAYNKASNEFLIVFQRMDGTNGNIFGVLVAHISVILGGGEFGIATWPGSETMPRVSASHVADEWAIVWQSDTVFDYKDIYARRLWFETGYTPQLSTPVHVVSSAFNDSLPVISTHPEKDTYLIAWEQQYSNSSGPYGILGRTLTSADNLGDLLYIRPIYLGETTNLSRPALAAGPTSWFVAWEHDRDAVPSYQDIHGRVVFDFIFADGFESGNMTAWSSTVP